VAPQAVIPLFAHSVHIIEPGRYLQTLAMYKQRSHRLPGPLAWVTSVGAGAGAATEAGVAEVRAAARRGTRAD
jgi:hypothetical protein